MALPNHGHHEDFKRELTALLNKYGIDTLCRTPDFVLAEYAVASFNAYRFAVHDAVKLGYLTERFKQMSQSAQPARNEPQPTREQLQKEVEKAMEKFGDKPKKN